MVVLRHHRIVAGINGLGGRCPDIRASDGKKQKIDTAALAIK